MAAKRQPKPAPPSPPSDPAGDDLRDEIEARVRIALDVDPANPAKKQLLRRMACAWLADKGVDLAARGLPLEVDREPEPPKRPELRVIPGTTLPPPAEPEKGFKNAEAEEGVLSALMGLPTAAPDILGLVAPEDFSYPQFRVIARAVKELFDAGRPHDAAHVIQELGGTARLDLAYGQETVSSIASKPVTAEQALAQAALVRENADQRNAVKALDGLRQGLVRGVKSAAEVAASARELLDRVGAAREAVDPLEGFRRWPAAPGQEVWHGPAGELVEMVSPQTEADPIAILIQFLVCYGSMIGRNAHWTVGGERHYCNLYALVAGPTGDGRKGTAKRVVDVLLEGMAGKWMRQSVHKGMSSGEGFLEVIRDQSRMGKKPHAGFKNKTAFWMEPEFGTTLELMNREGNSLMGFLRDAWDGNDFGTSVKEDPMWVTKPYVSVCAHITFSDIHKRLSANSMLNGFANRFLVVCARRTRDLPHGGDLRSLNWKPLRRTIVEAIGFGADEGRGAHPVPFDPKAYDLWTAVYPELMRLRHEAIAAMAQRCAPMVRRIAVIYAMLDQSKVVSESHLLAALELWRYSERSLNFIFGGERPKEDDTEKVYAEIKRSAEDGVSRYEINRNLFSGRKTKEVASSLQSLLTRGLIDEEVVKRGNNQTPVYRCAGMSPAARPRARRVVETANPCQSTT